MMAAAVELARAPGDLRRDGAWGARLLGCTLVAAVVAVDPWGLAPFGPARFTVIAVGALAAAATLAGRTLRLDPRMALAWCALLGWLLIAALRGADPLHAWIGTPERRLGWLSWVLLALAWVIGLASGGAGQQRRVVRAATGAAAALGLYAVAELAGVAPVEMAFAGGRLGGPFGQPAFLGAAAALLTPVSIGLAADRSERRAWRAVAFAAAVLGAVALLGAQARAAWVGLALACLPLAAAAWRLARRRPALGLLAVVAAATVLLATPLGPRVASIADPSGTASARADEWRTGLAALTEAPLLGYGPEGYRTAFPGVVDADYARAHGRDVIPDRAHSGVLDVALSGGIPAALAYIVLIAGVAASALRALRLRDPLLGGVAVGVLAFVVQQQLLFPALEVDVLFWALAGTLMGAGSGEAGAAGTLALRLPRALGAGVAVLATALLLAGTLEVAADRTLRSAASAGPASQRSALAAADRAVALRPDSIRARFVAARIAARAAPITAIDAALERIEAALVLSPRDPALRAEQGRLLAERARRSLLPADLDRARAVLTDLVADDPAHPAHRLLLAAVLAAAGDPDGAAHQREAAASLAHGAGAGRR